VPVCLSIVSVPVCAAGVAISQVGCNLMEADGHESESDEVTEWCKKGTFLE
jgi:hypothetical protein